MDRKMVKDSVHEQIKKQKDVIAQIRKRLRDLEKQAREAQAKQLVKLAEKAGLFAVEISDEALIDAFEKLVKSAQSPPKTKAVSS